ncbi:hypothetical protein [Microvirga sp. KLBC 81]|nr:hypothetical protein [Microvirga sp. KLBC 81]
MKQVVQTEEIADLVIGHRIFVDIGFPFCDFGAACNYVAAAATP